MFEEDADLLDNIQEEDNLEGMYKLFGPYKERQTAKHPLCSYIEVCTPELKYFYQRKGSVPSLVILLEHYFRFEAQWQRDNIVENIQNRAFNFIKTLREAKPNEIVSKYYKADDSAKELFNIEIDCDKSFSTLYSALRQSDRSFTINQTYLTKNSKRNHRTVGVVLPLWDGQYMFDYVYSFLLHAVAYIKVFDDLQIRELLRYQFEPLFRN